VQTVVDYSKLLGSSLTKKTLRRSETVPFMAILVFFNFLETEVSRICSHARCYVGLT
jgi:hypothetical protein